MRTSAAVLELKTASCTPGCGVGDARSGTCRRSLICFAPDGLGRRVRLCELLVLASTVGSCCSTCSTRLGGVSSATSARARFLGAARGATTAGGSGSSST